MAMQQFKQQKARIPLILFKIGDEEFAINLLDAKEIIQAGQVRKLPESHDYLEGIYNYRGKIIHIINLRKKLRATDHWRYRSGVGVEDIKHINVIRYFIISTINGNDVGFTVDDVMNISYVTPESIDNTYEIIQTSIDIDYIKGIVKLKDKPRILIDFGKILNEGDQQVMQNQETEIPA
ncbi:MAG TPA: chemotaxis protein CheW [Candidatus Lokiarchaeia archaeon]|nr:chemotaxis protein CheW [Candidatus Lokiarchaeia archaeon]